MQWHEYISSYTIEAKKNNYSPELIQKNLNYAYNLYEKNLPILYDVTHLSMLVGIKKEYIYKITNSQKSGYRKFSIPKKNAGFRIINEPLPNLKIIQKWILTEILEKVELSPFAKAYRKKISLKDNVKFHKNQKIVMKLDVESFFYSLKEDKVLIFFISLGYSIKLSVVLTKLCTLKGGLPQGAPTSACLSNILMREFDNSLSNFCKENEIRYTRYADDLTFSGNFSVEFVYHKVQKLLSERKLKINHQKTKIMRSHNQQMVTGITVNNKIRVHKKYRKKIRQEIFFIKKFGVVQHLINTNQRLDKDFYVKSLSGKIKYCLFIDPKDSELKDYLIYINNYLESS